MTSDEEWARQLLSALPRPRMPDDARSRLMAAIAEESARGASGVPAPLPAPPAALPEQRARRRRPIFAGLIGAAAALTLFAVVDPLGTVTYEQNDSTIAGEAEPESAKSGAPDAGAAADDAAVLLATQTAYNRAELGAQARHTATRASAAPSPPADGAPAPAVELGAAQLCVSAIPQPKGSLVFIDRASFEGEPALIVAFRTDDQLDVVVQRPSCTRNDPGVEYRVTVELPLTAGE